MNRLTDKVAIVTGAAQGLGETHAKSLAAEGAKVMVSDLDDPSREWQKSRPRVAPRRAPWPT